MLLIDLLLNLLLSEAKMMHRLEVVVIFKTYISYLKYCIHEWLAAKKFFTIKTRILSADTILKTEGVKN